MVEVLPEYDAPPLDEVVMGIQFAPLSRFRQAHLGVYWSRIRDRYPLLEDHAPIFQQVEPQDIVPSQPSFTLDFSTTNPFTRSWYLTDDRRTIIQLQRDKFVRNWRRIDGEGTYPRYQPLVDAFRKDWLDYLDFNRVEDTGDVSVNQCEFSYINRIERGSGWERFADLSHVFAFMKPTKSAGFLPEPELVTWTVQFRMPDGKSRLYAKMSPAFRPHDFKMVLSLELIVRGEPSGKDESSVFAWFDTAHDWIVRAFDEITGPDMHRLWGKR